MIHRKRDTKIYPLLIAACIVLAGCNKTKRFSNRLAGETWEVTTLTIAGQPEESDHLPTLVFKDCDIYNETCMGEWEAGSGHAAFAWQFNEQGDTFVISNQSGAEDEHDHAHDEEHTHVDPVLQCQELSGTFSVREMKRKLMRISSTETIGHPGEEVVIEMKRID